MMKIVVSTFLLLFLGCKLQTTTNLDHTSTSTLVERMLVDSVVLRDSIIIRETTDTVFFTKYRTLYKERVRIDTIFKCDTIYTERTISVKEKSDKRFFWWLLVPLIAVLWKIGLFDLLRNLIMKRIK